MDNQATMKLLAEETLLQQKKPETIRPTGIRTQSRIYTKRENAIDAAHPYSNFIKEDVYVYESKFGTGDSQFSLRTREEIRFPNSPCVIHFEKYIKPQPKGEIPPTIKPEQWHH